MRDGTDELVLHLLGLFQPFGHLVDGAAQAVHLVVLVASDRQAHIQLTPGDAGCGALYLPQRHHDAADEVQAGHHGESKDHRRDHNTYRDGVLDLRSHKGQAGNKTHRRHILGGIGHQITGRHHQLAGLGAVDRHTKAIRSLLRLLKVGAGHNAVRICAAGGRNDPAIAVQQHELVFVLIGKLLHHAAQGHAAGSRRALHRIAGVHFQLAGHRREPPVHGLLHAVIIAACVVVQEHGFGQQHQQHGDEQVAPQPPAGNPASHSSHL